MAMPKMHVTHHGFAAVRRIEGFYEPGATPMRIELRMRGRVARDEIARTALALGGMVGVRRVRQIQMSGKPVVLVAEVRTRMTPEALYDLIEASGDWAAVEKLTIAARADFEGITIPADLVGAAA